MLKCLMRWWSRKQPSEAKELIAALHRPPLDFCPGGVGFNTPRVIVDSGVMVWGVLWLPDKVLTQPEMRFTMREEKAVAAAYRKTVAEQQRLICMKAKEAL